MTRLNQKGIVHLLPLLLLAAAGITLFIITSNIFDFSKNPLFSSLFPKPSSQASSERANKTKYASNHFLVKVKDSFKDKIKENPSPADTGISTLDNLNKKMKINKIEKITRANSKSNKESAVFRWYKISIPGNGEIITDENYNPGDINTSNIPDGEVVTLGEAGASGQLKRVMAAYKRLPEIEAVEVDLVVEAINTPNDSYFSSNTIYSFGDAWDLDKMNMSAAWDKTTGDNSVVVAVVDTGVDYNHPDLKDNILRDAGGNIVGYDYFNNDIDPIDDHGHGTHVAGTIGATGNNDPNHSTDTGTKTVGVNWNIKIMPVKFIGSGGSGYISGAVSSWQFAVDNGAKVINNSWGGSGGVDLLKDAADYVVSKNAVNIAAAGNNNLDTSGFSPANMPKLITVAATNHNDAKSCYSNYGIKIDVGAPGGDSTSCGGVDDAILSARAATNTMCTSTNSIGNYYCLARGTSMASPHVAGLAALILSVHPDFTPEEVRSALRKTADKVTGSPWDSKLGYGRINAASAVNINVTPATAKIYSPTNSTIYGGSSPQINITGVASSRNNFQKYELQFGSGGNPTSWTTLFTGTTPVDNGVLGNITLSSSASGVQTIRLLVTDAGGIYEDRIGITLDSELLPGWPKLMYLPAFLNSTAVGDIDGNDIKEIAYLDGCNLFVKKLDGNNLSGFPQNVCLYGTDSAQSITIADLNNDSKLEIIINSSTSLYVFKFDGTPLPGWPLNLQSVTGTLSAVAYNIPAIGDINGDGSPDIIIAVLAINSQLPNYEMVYAFGSDGRQLPGWPVKRNDVNTSFFTSMMGVETQSLADLDGDGALDVIQTSMQDNKVYAWKGTGTLMAGWPKTFNGLSLASLSVGKRNSDGATVIGFAGDGSNNRYRCSATSPCKLFLIDKNGNNIPGWPKDISGCNYANCYIPQIVFADVDGDGEIEYVYRKTWTSINAFKLDGSSSQLSITSVSGGRPMGNGPFISAAEITGDTNLELGVPIIDNYPGMYIYSYPNKLIWYRDYNYLAGSIFTGGDVINFSDLDNDGKVEIIGIDGNFAFNSIWVWKMNSSNHLSDTPLWERPIYNALNSRNANFDTVPNPSSTPLPTLSPTPTPTPPPAETIPPTVSITSPANNATVVRNSNITISADATDNVAVSRVEFYVDNSLKCTDSVSGYSCTTKIGGKPGASHTIRAKAYDTSGNFAISTITVTAK